MIDRKMISFFPVLWIISTFAAFGEYNTMGEYSKAQKWMGREDYAQAIQKFREIIENKPEFLRASRSLVKAYAAKQDLGAAIGFFTDKIGKDKKNGCFYFGLGYAYEQNQQVREALNAYKTALTLVPTLQETYDGFVDMSVLMGKEHREGLTEAENFLKQLIEKNPSNACAYQGLGYLYLRQYQWDKALEQYDKAVQIKKDFWQVYHDKATVYWQTDQYQKALGMLKTEFDLAEKNNDFEVMSKAIGNRGSVYSYLDDYQNALSCYRRSLSIAEEIGDQRGMGTTLGNIGFIYYKMGNYDKAMDFYQQALDKHRAVKNRFSEGLILGNLGNLYSDMGDYEKAFAYDENALKIHQETANKKSEGIILGNIGSDHFYLGHFDKSIEYHKKALEIHRSLKNKRSEGIGLENIGIGFLKNKNHAKAKEFFDQALAIDRSIGNKENEGLVSNLLGDLYSETGASDTADSCYQKALQTGQKYAMPNVVWKAYKGLGMLREKQGRFPDALSCYRSAIREIEEIRDHMPTEQYKMGFFEDKIENYTKLVQLLAGLHQNKPDQKTIVESFQYAEMSKARTLLEGFCLGPSFLSGMKIAPDLREKLLINKKKLEKKHNEISDELGKDESARDEKPMLKLKDELERLQREEESLFREMKEKYPGYDQLTHPEIIGPDKIMREILKPNQVLVEYMVGQEKTVVWILTPRSMEFKSIALNQRQMGDMLGVVSPLFRKGKDSSDVQMDHRWANMRPETLHKLYQILLEKPAGRYLQKGIELIIVPDHILFYFPFEILVTGTNGKNVHYLIEQHPVSYAYSASLLNPKLRRERRVERDLLALGNPDFSGEQDRGILDWVRSMASLKSIFRNNRFEPLPNAEVEVRAIANHFDAPAVYVGKQATEEIFKRTAGQFRYIHLATHFLNSDRQPMYSKIVMSQSNKEMEDGFLQTYEILELRLNADLVVLSGCDTGLGKLTQGEGLIGMTRAILHAGVPSTIVSLWPVEDESTSHFMAAFYRNLKAGLKKNLALQQAKIDMIHSPDSKRDPFYWGPFVLIGDCQ
jgi:CHAT domain-containing protein/tetratricopeptide (TPR) repeat protein